MNEILLGDCRELIKAIPDDSIDLIFTDPPYDKASVHLYAWLAEAAARVLRPGGFCMAYVGNIYFDVAFNTLQQHLDYYTLCFTYERGSHSIIWMNGIIQLSKPLMLFCKPPKRKAYHLMNTVYETSPDKRYHKWGQPLAPAAYYIHCLSQPGETVLEPFAGGGTTCIAAKQEGRNFIAFEQDPIAWERANKRLQTFQPKLITSFEQQLELLKNT